MAKIQVTQNGKVLVTQNGGVLLSNTSELVTKTITENGTYLASSDNVDGYSEVTVNVSGSSDSGTTDVELTRFKDDNNNEIGTHYMNFQDGNGNVFKVILLDAQYRLASAQWCSYSSKTVTNLPQYSNLVTSNVWVATETATFNTQKILDFCTSGGYTSSSCSHCRSMSFTIDGVIYYGQLPNWLQVLYLAKHYNDFDTLDTSASSQSSLNFSSSRDIWTSSQYNISYGYSLRTYGYITDSKTINHFVAPVLEIPA